MKHYFIDTNVFLDNIDCINILQDNNKNKVYIPYTVILELDKLKKSKCISPIVNKILDNLDNITILPQYPIKYNDFSCLDDVILNEICVYSEVNNIKPTLVTNDKIFQIKAKQIDIQVEPFIDIKETLPQSVEYTGIIDLDKDDLSNICNYFVWENGVPVFNGKYGRKRLDYQHKIWKVKPKNIYQNMLFELLTNDNIDVISVQSEAGKGKSFLVLATALYLTLEKKKYDKIYIIKPTIEAGRELGFLPGILLEKLKPFMRNVKDLVIKLHNIRPANKLFIDAQKDNFEFNEKYIECMPINYMRGVNLDNAIVIIEEAQGFTRYEMRTLLTRVGENCKVFITGDVRQIDNEKLNEMNNGLEMVVKYFKGLDNYAHFVLKGKSVRGQICDMVLRTGL